MKNEEECGRDEGMSSFSQLIFKSPIYSSALQAMVPAALALVYDLMLLSPSQPTVLL